MTLLRIFRGLFAHDCPSRREMLSTQDVCAALDARVDQVYDELRQLRGKVNGMRRWEKAADEADHDAQQPRQDAPQARELQRRVVGAPQIPRRNY